MTVCSRVQKLNRSFMCFCWLIVIGIGKLSELIHKKTILTVLLYENKNVMVELYMITFCG
jgi:DNA-binding transcriptional regulator of glucitol operon